MLENELGNAGDWTSGVRAQHRGWRTVHLARDETPQRGEPPRSVCGDRLLDELDRTNVEQLIDGPMCKRCMRAQT